MSYWPIEILYANDINYKTMFLNEHEFSRNICGIIQYTLMLDIKNVIIPDA